MHRNNKKNPGITVCVPAHNEQNNISNLLNSVLKQEGDFMLEKIYVALDACTDGTAQKVIEIRKKDKRVILIKNYTRKGKAARLNQMLSRNTSQYVAFFDADIVLTRTSEIQIMIQKIQSNKDINVVAGRQVPYSHTSFIGKITNASFNMWYRITSDVNDGNHIHNLHGSASLLKGTFAKRFRFPIGVMSDQCYLYLSAVKNNKNGFALANDTQILFRMVSTITDARKQGTRSIYDDKKNIVRYFGDDAYNFYKIPIENKARGLIQSFAIDPVYSFFAIFLGLYIRKFPYQKVYEKEGVWSDVTSTKLEIRIY